MRTNSTHALIASSIATTCSSLTRQHANRVCAPLVLQGCHQKRALSQTQKASTSTTIPIEPLLSKAPVLTKADISPLSRLSTANLMRSLMMGYTFSSPRLLSLSLRTIKTILDSDSALLNPDKNPVMRRILRAFIYDQYCAGTTPAEVRQKVKEIKAEGCSGVILGYAREILADDVRREGGGEDAVLAEWVQGNMETLALIESGDHTNLKLTGAGPTITELMLAGKPPPEKMVKAMDTICNEARARGVRVWIDAEMQFVQPSLHSWAVDFMRRYNRNGDDLIYNTYQSYLKSSRATMTEHMKLAKEEGWTMGVKLVRGAYILNDVRDRIWDTKAETDANYNGIVRDILSKTWAPFEKQDFPDVRFFLAGHNKESIRLATQLIQDLINQGEKLPPVRFAQLQGMADDVGHELIQLREAAYDTKGLPEEQAQLKRSMAPLPYRCLCWGTVAECLGFLMRRAVENASATDRLKDGLTEIRAELKRRFLPFARR